MGLLYTKMKIFHYMDKLDSLPQKNDRVLAPLHIRIKPTNICNHRCSYCAYRAENLQLGTDMNVTDTIPREKMFEIIDDIIAMKVKAVTFSGGGEPFCYPHLLETVIKLAAGGVKFAALTNGAGLKGEIADVFARHATWVRVSMDGWDPQSYAKYRCVPDGEFLKVIDNMKAFKKKEGNCYLGISFIVDQQNASHIHDFVRMMRDLGVDSVKVSPKIVSNNGYQNNEYHASVFNLAKEETAKAIRDFSGENFEIFDSYHLLEDKFSKTYSWCPYLQILPIIGADCRVYSCQDKAYNIGNGMLGSIVDRRFKDFWFSGKQKFFRINPSIHCDHHCVANTKNHLILEYSNADKEHLGFV
ncbi:MAG: radical SAM protein [Proteobacteria bacterium]|nr:radical SAM protein [Desulfobacula sp.]MBU4133649.1 radical SAM protein [Pseudomonadota bacterium]